MWMTTAIITTGEVRASDVAMLGVSGIAARLTEAPGTSADVRTVGSGVTATLDTTGTLRAAVEEMDGV